MVFNRNLSVVVQNNRVVSRQNGSTPGVYKFFNVEADTKYKINLDGYDSRVTTTLWIVNNGKTSNEVIKDVENLHYYSNNRGTIKIGVLFKFAKYGSYFELRNIYLSEVDPLNVENNIVYEKVDQDILEEYYAIKNEMNKLDISVVIPCHYKHFYYLAPLLEFYNKQTMIPKEIIVVLSQSNMVYEKDIQVLKSGQYLYELKIVCIEEKSPAGKNRQIGSKDAKGDIIIFQDADDFPHFQRNEIIHKCFIDNPDISHILHGFSRNNVLYKNFDIDHIPIKIFHHNMFNNHKEMASYNLTNGNIAIRKNIVDKVRWEDKKYRGQDVIFNKNLYALLRKYLIIRLPLYVYRENLSVKKYVSTNKRNMRFNM